MRQGNECDAARGGLANPYEMPCSGKAHAFFPTARIRKLPARRAATAWRRAPNSATQQTQTTTSQKQQTPTTTKRKTKPERDKKKPTTTPQRRRQTGHGAA